jgi:hypothetical protein
MRYVIKHSLLTLFFTLISLCFLLTSHSLAQGLLINGDRTIAGRLNFGSATGSTNAYVLTLSPPIAQLRTGLCVLFAANAANTGPATLNLNGTGVKTLKKRIAGVAQDLAAGDIGTGQLVTACYDGVNMQADIVNPGNVVSLSLPQTWTALQTFTGVSLGASPQSVSVANETGTGTTAGLLVSFTGAPSTATKAALSATSVDGICVSGCGASGTAEIATGGITACTFENATVAGRLVIPGTSTAGQCRDSGQTLASAIPMSTPIVGVVLVTGAAGSRNVNVYGERTYGTQVNLTTNVTGINPVVTGGTGAATFTAGLLKGSGTSALTTVTAPSGAIVGDTDVQTLSGKRITKRAVVLTDAATVTLNWDTTDLGILTTLSQTTNFANGSGTPTNGQFIMVRIKSATARPVTFGTQYRGSVSAALPTTTSGGNLTDYWGFVYNLTDAKADFMPAATGF